MIKRIVTYIGREPWDVEILRQEKILNRCCWAAIAIALIVFVPVCLRVLAR